MSFRVQKINELIKRQMSEILSHDLNLKPGIFMTVSKVDTTKDLRYTQVFISIFPQKETEYAIKTLEKEKYFIQGELNKKLHLKILPRIKFKVDTTEAKADRIEKILKKIGGE